MTSKQWLQKSCNASSRKMAAKKRLQKKQWLQKNCKDMASKNGLNSWGKNWEAHGCPKTVAARHWKDLKRIAAKVGYRNMWKEHSPKQKTVKKKVAERFVQKRWCGKITKEKLRKEKQIYIREMAATIIATQAKDRPKATEPIAYDRWKKWWKETGYRKYSRKMRTKNVAEKCLVKKRLQWKH